MKHWILCGVITLGIALLPQVTAAQSAKPVVLTGVVRESDKGSYREIPFDVPPGVEKITVDITWKGRERGTVLVTGLFDPERLRGWGGGIKPHFVVAEGFASPSYLPGPIPAGRWRLSMAVASIRSGEVSPYTVQIRFDRGSSAQVVTDTPVRDAPGWYRGDLHTHDAHSDGACRSVSGQKVGCPLFLTLKSAVEHHLDFVVVTDHNASSHVADLAELAPYYDTLLAIPGREITTDVGHFNLFGIIRPIDFRIAPQRPRSVNDIFRAAHAAGALVSINHPEIPTGEDCLGCGWSAPATDYSQVDAIEIANGGIAADRGGFDEGPGSGIAFWEALLDRGFQLTGVGGSDNHDSVDGRRGSSPVGAQSPVGTPATVVHASQLSQNSILQGIKAGRVFVDLAGATPGRFLDMQARAGSTAAMMGQALHRPAETAITISVEAVGLAGMTAELIVGGETNRVAARAGVLSDNANLPFSLSPLTTTKWFRVDVRNTQGRLVLIGNPIYVMSDVDLKPAIKRSH